MKEKRQGYIVLKELESVFHKFDENQYLTLKSDIEKNGISTPIIFLSAGDAKIVVDGHIRLRIADELNLTLIPEFELKESLESIDEVKIWIVKNQCQRRNLSKNQRVRMAFALKDSIAALAHKNLSLAASNGSVEKSIDTLLEIGKIAGVSRTTVAKYQTVLVKGSDETRHRMLEGDISINNVYDIAKNSEQEPHLFEAIERVILKENYIPITNFVDGKKKMKSGLLECIMIVPKGKENQVSDTNVKTGLLILD